jgi:hypothetical protein
MNSYKEYSKKEDTEMMSQKELLKIEIYKEEEEIIDELINQRTLNNIHCIKNENISKNSPIKTKYYKFKSKIKCYSADGKKTKNTKLNKWINNNIENTKKLEEDVEDLIIEIFVNRFNTYPEKECPLSSNALQSKKQIDVFCPKFYEFSIYILSLLHKKIYDFFENLSKKIDFKSIPLNELNKIKEILFYTGVDIKIVFKKAFEKTKDFDLSKILMIMFDEYLIKSNKKIEEINKEIKNSPFYKEKENFEKFIKKVKENIYYFDIDKQTDVNKDNTYNNNNYYLLNDVNNKEKINNNDSHNNNKIVNNNKNNELISKNKEDKNNDKQNAQINNNDKDEEKDNNNKNSCDNKEKRKNKKKENIKEYNNIIQNLNIDDLVNYINDSGKGNKKKKKKKKKSKKQEAIVKTNEDQENYIEEDLVYLNYKTTLEEYSNNLLIKEKIKPHYSEEFLKKLQILCNSI